MIRNAALVASLGLSLLACRGSSGDDTQNPDAPVTGAQHIQDVQNDQMAPGTPVSLSGVIVTAIDSFGAKTGDIWVEEPGGGPFSGVHVFGAPLDQVSALALGDIVDIAGAEKDEFAYMGNMGVGGDTSGRSVTELKPVSGGMMTVTKTGTGTVPAPEMVDALAIGQKATQAERDAEWEKWEGVLIKVPTLSATSSAKCVGSACNDNTLNQFDATGGIVVESALAAFPGTAPGTIAKGDCLASVTGVVDYFFDYLLLNTSTDAVATGGSGCPVAEGASHAVCSDGIDNDGNGFSDCMDNGCVVGDSACRAQTTINALQTGATLPTGAIELSDVVVTAISFNKKNLWVSSTAVGAANEGIYIFRGSNAAVLPANVVIGAHVRVIGTAVENNNDMNGTTLTEVNGLDVSFLAAPTVQPTPVAGQTVASLLAAGTGEPYESVLVTLTNVKVTSLGSMATFGVGNATQKAGATLTTFTHDDDIYRFVTADNGVCYATITGIWTYDVFNNVYYFLPRTLAGSSNPATPDGTIAGNSAVCN